MTAQEFKIVIAIIVVISLVLGGLWSQYVEPEDSTGLK